MSLYNELKSSIVSGNINDNRKKLNYSAERNFIHEETDDAHTFLTTLIDVLKDDTKFLFIDIFFHVTRKCFVCDSFSNNQYNFQD